MSFVGPVLGRVHYRHRVGSILHYRQRVAAGLQVEVTLRFFVGIEVEGVYFDKISVITWFYFSSVQRFWYEAIVRLVMAFPPT